MSWAGLLSIIVAFLVTLVFYGIFIKKKITLLLARYLNKYLNWRLFRYSTNYLLDVDGLLFLLRIW